MAAPGGMVADRYRVLERLARSEVSDLLRAEDTTTGRAVALELFTEELSQRARLGLSERVSRARRISHDRVAALLDHGVHPIFVATELPDGIPLAALFEAGGRVEPVEARSIALDVARGLEAIHGAGVALGALDPAHVLVDEEGGARLVGFPASAEGETLDSRWASPDVRRGEPAAPSADLYSLGAMLAELSSADPRGGAPLDAVATSLRAPRGRAPSGSASDLVRRLEDLEAALVSDSLGWPRAIADSATETSTARTTPEGPVAKGSTGAKARVGRPDVRFLPGDRVAGRYRVEGLLGRGGFAEVYRVRDEARGEAPVALKLHRLHGRRAQLLTAIEAEFALLASLSHPSLATVYDFGHVGEGLAYFTQQLVEGVPLHRAGIGIDEPRMIRLLAQLCRALDYLHARGLLHRDVKGSNVLVDVDRERLTLLDFGIARAFGATEGPIAGTIGYLAPEAFGGGALDGRADLYAVGAVLYRLISGRNPYRGSPSGIVLEQLQGEPRRIDPARIERGEVSAPMAGLVERLLSREPAARHASAGELLEDLARVSGVDVAFETSETLASYVLSAPTVGDSGRGEALREATSPTSHGVVVALIGEGGTGKSRLLRDRRVEVLLERRRWIEARPSPSDAGLMVILDLARGVVTASVAAALEHDERIELARAMPELLRPGERVAVAVDPESARRARLRALARAMCVRFARRPGVIAVEDVQHAGPRALGQLAELIAVARELEVPAAFVLTARPGHRIEALLASVPDAVRCATGELSAEAARELVAGVFGDATLLEGSSLARALERPQSALWVQEAIRLALDRGDIQRREGAWRLERPPAALPLDEVLRERVKLRSATARRLISAAAVFGRPATLATLAALGSMDLPTVSEGTGELVRAGLMEDAPSSEGPVRYAIHDRFAELMIERASPEELRRLHARASAWLARSAGDWRALGRAARHAERAAAIDGAIELLERGVEAAKRAGRPDAALELLGRQLGLVGEPAPVPLLLARLDLAKQAGLGEVAEETLRWLLAARSRASESQAQRIALREAQAAAERGDAETPRAIVADGLAWARAQGDAALELRWRLLDARIEKDYGRLREARDRFEAAAELAAELGDAGAEARAYIGASYAAFYLGDVDGAVSYAAHGVAASDAGDLALLSESLRNLATAQRGRGELLESMRLLEDAVSAARACGSIADEAKALNNLSMDASRVGDIGTALGAARRAIELKERMGAAASADITRSNLGYVSAALGRAAEARALLEGVRERAESRLIMTYALTNLAELHARDEDLVEARALFAEGLEVARRHEFDTTRAHSLTGLIRVDLMRGDLETARENLVALREICARLPFERCRLETTEAMVLAASGEPELALEHAREACEDDSLASYLFGTFGSRFEAQWIRALRAKAAGHEAEAKEALSRARLDMTWLAEGLEDEEARETFRTGHPMRRAIQDGDLDLPPGWTWRPRRARA